MYIKGMETLKDLGTFTFPSLLKNSVKKFGGRPALSLVEGSPITYSELSSRVDSLARMLAALDLKPGDKIALYGTSRPEWGISYFAVVCHGMIAVPLLPDFSETEVESILSHCGVDAMFVSDKLYEKIKGLEQSLPRVLIRMEDFSILKGGKGMPEDFASTLLQPYTVKEDDTASIIYTSGTTGRSKGVELSHKNLVWNAVQGQTVHRVNKMDRCLSFLPLSHVYEFTIGFTMQVLNGACVYYLGKPPTVSALLPAFAKIQPTIICSVPLVVEKIYKNKVLPAFSKNKFVAGLYKIRPVQKILNRMAGKQLNKTFGGHVVFFGIGGAKVDPKVERFLKDSKFNYAIGYGLTETSPLLAGSGPRITLPGTIGPVLQGVEMTLLNKDEKTGVGEVVVKGPNVMKGYYREPELTAAAFTTEEDSCGAGWFRTGDLGVMEKMRGLVRLSLKGRSKNMILGPSGENIYPEDIEFVLNQHPLVSESLVVEDDAGLVALIQMDKDAVTKEAETRVKQKSPSLYKMTEQFRRDVAYQREVILSEIQFFVNSRVSRNSHVGKVREVPEFEKTASQKIKRYLYDLRTKISKGKKK